MSRYPVIIETIISSPIATVWNAITNKDIMRQWYFDLGEFKPEVGFVFEFFSGNKDGFQYLHKCKVTEVIPGKKITYSWRYDGYDGNSFVTFELSEETNDPSKTKLILTHSDLETLPKSNPDFAPENFVEGWNQIIGKSLKEYLEK